MTERNLDLREMAKQRGVFLWKIAEELNLSDANFSRLLRKELTAEKKEQIRNIILGLAKREGVPYGTDETGN